MLYLMYVIHAEFEIMKQSFLLLLCLFFLSGTVFAQKVKIKDEIATVDGVDYVKWVKKRGTEITVLALNSDVELIFVQYLSYADPSKISKSNPEGKVRWIELNFLEQSLICEVSSLSQKGLVKLLLDNKIFVDGELNVTNVEKFVAKYGARFSENRPASVIIINN